MDLSVPRLSSCHEASPTQPLYQPFAVPAPPGMSRSYSSNVLTPGVIPSPLNFPSLTPPSSPFYGIYSPSPSQHVSPLYDPSYLRKLKSNPIFRDLQSVLLQECTQMQVPANLITTSWNLMQLNPTNNNNDKTATNNTNTRPEATTNCDKVYTRHINLQNKILKVRIDPSVSADGLSVENDYSEQVGKIEMDRYRALQSCPAPVKDTINSYYDTERLTLADKTESELDKLISKAENLRKSVTCGNLKNSDVMKADHTKQLSDKFSGQVDGASLLLQQEEKMNAVRKLQFNITNDNSANDDDDYLNCSVNSEDFEIDEIDVETIETKDKVNCESSSRQSSDTSVQSNTVSQSVPQRSPVMEDLLQKCITESGIADDHPPHSPALNTSSISTDKPFSEGSCTSPMSLDSVKSTSSPENTSELHQNTFKHSTNQIADRTNYQCSSTNQQSPFTVNSLYQPMKFLPVENINSALSHMQKICSGPSVSFTPESRRDFAPNFTPDFTPDFKPKMLPLSDLTQSYRPNHTTQPASCVNQQQGPSFNPTMWTSPLTQSGTSIWSQPSSTQQGTSLYPTNQSRKRKSLCDENQDTVDLKNNNFNQNGRTNVSSNTATNDSDLTLDNPVFRTHRMLTAESTNVLSNWYHSHVNYPYPNEEEVEQLAQMTGITGRQVKKWMANKRVRCFNTLSITGNQHPIKFKYKSQGRKKKSASASTTSEKENGCDSTTSDKKPNYSMLSQNAKVILNNWYENNVTNPYPTEEEKKSLAETCSITVNQVQSWFANKRNRTNNTKRQVPNYFLNKHPEYSQLVEYVGYKREETRMIKRRKINEVMYIQPQFYF